MDINEKIAARRRELEAEARTVQAQEAENRAAGIRANELAQAAAREARKQREDVERAALDEAVQQRMKDEGIVIPPPSKEKIDAAVEARLSKAATDQMTKSENIKFSAFILLGLGSCFIAWYLVIFFFVIAYFYHQGVTEKYKAKLRGNSNGLEEEVAKRFGGKSGIAVEADCRREDPYKRRICRGIRGCIRGHIWEYKKQESDKCESVRATQARNFGCGTQSASTNL